MGRKNIGLQLDYNKHKKRSMIFLSVFILLVGCGKSTTESITGSFENENEELEEEQTLTWQDQYDLGLRYLSDGNYEEAIIAFKAAIQIDPKRAVGYLYLAEVYCDNGEYDEALRLVDDIPEDIDDMDAISELKKWLESDEKNYPMLMTQDLYDAERGHIWQASYTYDEKGYLIRIDSCEYDENGKNDFIISYIWEYEEFDHAWYFTIEPTGIGEYDQIHEYCGHFRAKGLGKDGCRSDIVMNKMTSTRPNLFQIIEGDEERPITVARNDDDEFYYHDDSMAIWSVAKYTYDEVGNAVRIDSYDEEGNLIAWCINTYAE